MPAYVYDLRALDVHAARIRKAMRGIEIFYAVKANPDPHLLKTLEPHIDGFEVSSGGELLHVRGLFPQARIVMGGPGKTGEEIELARVHNVERLHVESVTEIRRVRGDILLRANLRIPLPGASLVMSGPFGMDHDDLARCREIRPDFRGYHTHLASGLPAEDLLSVARAVQNELGPAEEFNLGGGMAVSYENPAERFDWEAYGEGLRAFQKNLRIEPGRALTVYCGTYVTRVLDVKRVHGTYYAIVAGGTHHIRTPATKGHNQPFSVIAENTPAVTGERVTLVGQLCTPKDVLASDVYVERIGIGDIVKFQMAGAYAWNISHHEFLMHPPPTFRYST